MQTNEAKSKRRRASPTDGSIQCHTNTHARLPSFRFTTCRCMPSCHVHKGLALCSAFSLSSAKPTHNQKNCPLQWGGAPFAGPGAPSCQTHLQRLKLCNAFVLISSPGMYLETGKSCESCKSFTPAVVTFTSRIFSMTFMNVATITLQCCFVPFSSPEMYLEAGDLVNLGLGERYSSSAAIQLPRTFLLCSYHVPQGPPAAMSRQQQSLPRPLVGRPFLFPPGLALCIAPLFGFRGDPSSVHLIHRKGCCVSCS